MRSRTKYLVFIPLCVCVFMLILSACTPSWDYLKKKEQGFYPDTSDFPNTKWTCRELDMYFYMFDDEEPYMIGAYTVNHETYRVVGTFETGRLNFNIYSNTQISFSADSFGGKEEHLVHCERTTCGYIYTDYLYENGTINCSLLNCQAVDGEIIPSTLTFDKTEFAAKNGTRWYAREVDMYLDSFDDIDGYLRGELVIDGNNCSVQALEIGNGNFYMFSIENGTINNLRPNTTSPLVYMYLDFSEDTIIARITDDMVTSPEAFPYWEYTGTVITFSQVQIDSN